MTNQDAIRLSGVSISFALGQGTAYQALAPLDLAVADSEFVAIVGPTGCGKSTLLNVAAGLARPSGGSLSVFGRPLAGRNAEAGYLFQQDALMPWKSALDNVAVGLQAAGMTLAEARGKSRDWLARVGLAAFAERFPHMLSGGQRKRVALAQVLIRNPRILLMDEPFGPLDAQTRVIMGDLLLELWAADRKAVLFVTHDLDEAIALADRVVVLSAGPSARIIGDYAIALERPREIADIRDNPDFHALHREIWRTLRLEVQRAYAGDAA